jgi:hypothetical protein
MPANAFRLPKSRHSLACARQRLLLSIIQQGLPSPARDGQYKSTNNLTLASAGAIQNTPKRNRTLTRDERGWLVPTFGWRFFTGDPLLLTVSPKDASDGTFIASARSTNSISSEEGLRRSIQIVS